MNKVHSTRNEIPLFLSLRIVHKEKSLSDSLGILLMYLSSGYRHIFSHIPRKKWYLWHSCICALSDGCSLLWMWILQFCSYFFHVLRAGNDQHFYSARQSINGCLFLFSLHPEWFLQFNTYFSLVLVMIWQRKKTWQGRQKKDRVKRMTLTVRNATNTQWFVSDNWS